MLASTSTSSTSLVAQASEEGLKHLYRTILTQARLLSLTLDDPIIYSSHRFLARKNLEPLLSTPLPSPRKSSLWPLPTSIKRILRARTHRRHLADANFGWEHSVHRALSLAYARSGKLRRDILSDLSPIPSTSSNELKYHEKHLRKKQFSPIITALLLSEVSMNGAPVKSVSHLTGRAPPPWLPAEDDALVKQFGKAKGRRRVSNANARFIRTYLRKVMVPLDVQSAATVRSSNGDQESSIFAHLEKKARPRSEVVSNRPKRFSKELLARRKGLTNTKLMMISTTFLMRAKTEMEQHRTKMERSEHRKQELRKQGWDSHPRDYSHVRTQRRLYGRILDETPLLLVVDVACTASSSESSSSTCFLTERVQARKNDPLGIRAKIGIIPVDVGHQQLKLVKSRYAVGPNSGRGRVMGEVVPRSGLLCKSSEEGTAAEEEEEILEPKRWLASSEIEFLRQQGLL
ncbi:uncharacterized protein MEPE_04653 [Melanopsichium pennsylvanicum]|uniref:Uncharacterized protein n=2 Tax=Melanopsichium pennsylvanicum TaxID=63383 RepID=A0AAJ4XN39_9BASI|nr:hypothetical protein BN887_00582 [Melanopsichium pennsylvanicum 4]SNX85944.1 uncharacterized protein MEPE_04653 [Melanopsichium pennsylvanicum]